MLIKNFQYIILNLEILNMATLRLMMKMFLSRQLTLANIFRLEIDKREKMLILL